jgi:hypothetical protein
MRFKEYVKTAFLNRWNILVFAAALGFSVVSGHADVFMPLALAGEIAYLGLLSAHPRFQAYVEAQKAKVLRQEKTPNSDEVMRSILRSLPAKSLERFESLRRRCRELRQIALEIKDPGRVGAVDAGLGLEESQVAGLDRLLWIYLRLLFTQYTLEKFIQQTSKGQIEKDIDSAQERLKRTAGIADEIQRQRVTRTLEDNLQTCRDRLANYEKAEANYQLVLLEIDRLENKIRSLSELAVNRQEPDFVSTQVDQVATSMLQTERTMNELQFATGLNIDEQVPPLLNREVARVTQ